MRVNSIIFMCIIFLMYGSSAAVPHYVSSSGTSSWAASTNIATPCSTRVAFDSAAAGDTVLFLGGTYTTPPKNFGNTYNGYFSPKNSGTMLNPIVFVNNPNDTVIFDGTTGGSGDTTSANHGVSPFATIFGTNNKSWIIFDGFFFQANNGTKMPRVVIGQEYGAYSKNGNNIIKNCVFNGGSVVPSNYSDNCEALRVEGNDKITISNCVFSNCNQESNNHNTSAFKSYACTTVVIENCEFFNNTVAIYFKSRTPKSTVRNCFIHDGFQGISMTPDMTVMSMDTMLFYNNLIVNNSSQGIYQTGAGASNGSHVNYLFIYNNTIIGNGSPQINLGYTSPGGNGARVYNNIIIGSGTYSIRTQDDSESWRNYLYAVDHNHWGTTFKTIRIGDNWRNTNYTSLANWQASNELENTIDVGCGSSQHPGCGDLQSDPLFVNTSGSLNMLSDFALQPGSPCNGAGRNGDTIGCNVATVGIGYEYTPPAPPDSLTVSINKTGNGTVLRSPDSIVVSGDTVFVTKTAATLFCCSGIDTVVVTKDTLHPVTFTRCYADTMNFAYRETKVKSGRNFLYPIIAKATNLKSIFVGVLRNGIVASDTLAPGDSTTLTHTNATSGIDTIRTRTLP